jgi:hypothetical protein
VAANVNIVVNAQDRASGVFRKIRTAFGEIFQVAVGVRLARVFQEVGQQIRAFAGNSIGAAADLQHFRIGIETLIAREQILTGVTDNMTEALAIAGSKSGDYISKLQEIALLSPFQFADVQQVIRQAMAFGFAHEEAMVFAESTLNVAAGVGATNDMLRRMSYNLAQIRLQGKVTKLDVRQLALAGFDLEAVLRHVGKTMEVEIDNYKDFNAALKTGKVTWADFTKGYSDYAKTYFGEASERMARTMFGLKNTFKDIFGVLMPQILGPALDAFTAQMSSLLDIILDLKDSGTLEEWGKNLKNTYDKHIKPVLDYLLYGTVDASSPIVLLLEFAKRWKDYGLEIAMRSFQIEFGGLLGLDLTPFIRFVDKLKDMVDYLKEGYGLLSDPVLANLGMMFGLEEDTLPNLKADIIAWATQLWEDIKTVFTQPYSEDTANILATLFGLDPQAVMDVQNFAKSITDYIGDRVEDVKPLAQEVGATLVEDMGPMALITAWAGAQIGKDMFPMLRDAFAQITEWLGGDGAEAFGKFMDMIRNLWLVIVGVGLMIWDVLGPILEILIPVAVSAITTLLEWLMLMLGGDPLGAGAAMLELMAIIDNAFRTLVGTVLKELVEAVWNLLGLGEFDWAALETTMEQLKLVFWNAMNEASLWAQNLWPSIKQAAIDFWNKFIEGSKETWDIFVTDLAVWWEAVKLAISTWYDKMKEAGKNAWQGWVDGMTESVSALKSDVTALFDGIIGWFKALLGIASPSSVFEEFGRQSMAGFLQGLQPQNTISMGVSAATAAARTGGIGSAPIIINNNYNGLTLNDRLQAETQLRPIVDKIVRK